MMKPFKIIIATNAFKNSLSARAAAEAIKSGLEKSQVSASITVIPVADGGDGTSELITEPLRGVTVYSTVTGPLGKPVEAAWGYLSQRKLAIIGLANASGLKLISPSALNPLKATTFGTGELINAALDRGAKEIILCAGGSGTVDVGTGILSALGVSFLGPNNTPLRDIGLFYNLRKIKVSGLDPRLASTRITILCDVISPLDGPNGAIRQYGPQKGASAQDILILEHAFSKLANIARFPKELSIMPRGGAAGGMAAGLHTFINAKLVDGITYFMEAVSFKSHINHANLVITGEGCLDSQTLEGKAPSGVAKAARVAGVPVIAVAGTINSASIDQLRKCFDVLLPISNGAKPLSEAILDTKADLERTGFELGSLLKCLQR